jgi:Xaa-Pro aminopeptidase
VSLFEPAEFHARVARAQAGMEAASLDALLLTTEPEVRYFTGYLTRFWESPTRPWFLIVPRSGAPIAVIPSIGAALMARTWITDIRTWRAPDLVDDGVSLLADTLNELGPKARIGMPDGHETHVRMPWADLERLKGVVSGNLIGDAGLMRALRMVKSGAEVALIETICGIAGRAFDRVPEIAGEGVPLQKVFRGFQMLGLEEGADWVPYLAGASAQGGYSDVISPATAEPLRRGDVLMLDTGMVRDGYFCDFDRNFSVGPPSQETLSAHARLIEAVDAGADAARPGATASDIFHVMDNIVTGGAGGSDAGRLGHGLGMQLTEWPSLIPSDHTILLPGMVLTLEPGIETSGGMLVHEENIVITETGCRFLSPRASTRMVQI